MKDILLVHGIFDSQKIFAKMSQFLRNNGWHTHTIDLKPNDGTAPLDELAEQVAAYERKHLSPHHPFTLLGFSMGGLVSRFYLQRMGGLERVQRFISISTPHHGTMTAYLKNNPGSKQMRPNSRFLADLNTDIDRLNQANHISLWTLFDLMIIPATSSKVPSATNKCIPVLLHPWMLTDQRCLSTVNHICNQQRRQAR